MFYLSGMFKVPTTRVKGCEVQSWETFRFRRENNVFICVKILLSQREEPCYSSYRVVQSCKMIF